GSDQVGRETGVPGPPGARVPWAPRRVCLREADPVGMPRSGPVRSTPGACGDPPAPADAGSPDDQDRRRAAAPPGAGPAPAGPPPFPRWLSSLLRLMRSRAVRVGFLAVVVVLLGIALDRQAGTLWHEIQRLSVPIVVLAFALCLCGLISSLLVWREMLADLGSRLSVPDAWRIMFIGQ